MKYNIDLQFDRFNNKKLARKIKKLNKLCFNEVYKGNKVSYLYKNINDESIIAFNPGICFYAASTIKILTCLIILNKALNNEINLEDEILVTMNDLKQDTGIIKYQKQDTYYTIKELVRLTIVESDNTSYLKLVDMIGKDKIKEYGNKLGAEYTMQGKETDSFGIVNAKDMLIYLEKIKEFIDSNNKYSQMLKEWMSNPSVKYVKDSSINNKNFVRKYGSYQIAYHEVGYVEDKNPYYLIILTQLNQKKYKNIFMNKVAKLITDIHNLKV